MADTVRSLAAFQILAYDETADILFARWPASIKRIGPNDCRIAASAIINGFVVVTRNAQDFKMIPNVVTEDWSR